MRVKYRDIRPLDRFSVVGNTEEGANPFERDFAADLKPDDDVVVHEWLGFPAAPHREVYLQWLEQQLGECLAAVQRMRTEEPDQHQFAESKLKYQIESLRRVLDMVRFPVLRNAITGLR